MLENGQIDRNTSLIKQYGAPGTTKFWQPIYDDIEHGLLNQHSMLDLTMPMHDMPTTLSKNISQVLDDLPVAQAR